MLEEEGCPELTLDGFSYRNFVFPLRLQRVNGAH